MTERLNAVYMAELENIDDVETGQGKVKIVDKEVIFTQTEDGKFTVGVKMAIRKRVIKMTENGAIMEQSNPELVGDYKVLSVDDPISEIRKAINDCIANIVEGIKEMYGQPQEA